MDDLEFIKKFSAISVAGVCRKLNVNRPNLLNGKLRDNINKQVRQEIESEIAKLYLKEDNNDKKD